jgi:SAM-dependent methyltransferase
MLLGVNPAARRPETDDRWRDALIAQIDPRARDIILDAGCGGGELAVLLKLDSPGSSVFGLDARPGHLDAAERRACDADARVNFVHTTIGDAKDKFAAQSPTQIVCSRVFGYLPFYRHRALLTAMFTALPRGGVVHIADTGWHPRSNWFARPPWARTASFCDDALTLLRHAGFTDCAVTAAIPSSLGDTYLFRGVKS